MSVANAEPDAERKRGSAQPQERGEARNKMKTLIASAITFVVVVAACDVIPNEPPDMQVLRESRPLGDAKALSVEVSYDVGKMEVLKSKAEDLFSIDLEYDRRRAKPTVHFAGSSLKFDLDNTSLSGGSHGFGKNNDLTLRLTDKVPIDLDIDTGVSEARLDLGGMNLRQLILNGGVGKTEMTFNAPTPQPVTEMRIQSGVGELIIRSLGNSKVGRLTLEGGVGRTEIDFTGELGTARLDATIEVGVGQIKLLLPREADIEIQAEGSFLSNVSAPSFERHRERRDLSLKETFIHKATGAPGEIPKIFIRIESGIGGVTVDLI